MITTIGIEGNLRSKGKGRCQREVDAAFSALERSLNEIWKGLSNNLGHFPHPFFEKTGLTQYKLTSNQDLECKQVLSHVKEVVIAALTKSFEDRECLEFIATVERLRTEVEELQNCVREE